MTIGIVTSGSSLLPLWRIASRFAHVYHVFLDRSYRPWGDKDAGLREKRVLHGVQCLAKQGVTHVILPPMLECAWLWSLPEQWPAGIIIVPLYQTYLQEHVLPGSLIGKLGILTQRVDRDSVSSTIDTLTKAYTLTEKQKRIKSFHHDFPLRCKEVRMRQYFATTLGARDRMVRKTIKTDLRYFCDAAVDTLVPSSWSMLAFEHLLTAKALPQHMCFHWSSAVEKSFATVLPWEQSIAQLLHITVSGGEPHLLANQKKTNAVLSAGNTVPVQWDFLYE